MNTLNRTNLSVALYCAIGAASFCALSTSVHATELDPPSKTVRFHDLDITNPEGAKALYGRIRAAARDVCGVSAGSDPIQWLAVKGCIEKAIDNAVRKVNAPELTALRFGSKPVRLASK